MVESRGTRLAVVLAGLLTSAACASSSTLGPTGSALVTTTTVPRPQLSVPVDPASCLDGEGDRVEIEGAQTAPYNVDGIAAGTILDAGQADWNGVDEDGEPITWVVTLEGGTGACWFGGRWQGAWDDTDEDVTWSDPYHHSAFLTLRLADFLVEGVDVTNQGDGIRMEEAAQNFHIRAAYLTDIHDDCVENDFMHSGILEQSLMDGCYVALSARHFEGNDADGSDNTWIIERNLIRMQAQPIPYSGPAPGHGPIFKWSEGGPGVVFNHNIIRVDQPPNHGTLGVPEEMSLEECRGNIVVWGGEGPYPDELPDCFSVTTDVSVWDEAVTAWEAARLQWDPAPAGEQD